MVLGFYQFIHAFVMSILKLIRKEFNWLIAIYWILGLVYMIGWVVLLAMSHRITMDDDVIITAVLLAWVPIVYYFIISIVDLFKSRKK